MEHKEPGRSLTRVVQRCERRRMTLAHALRTIAADPSAGWMIRSEAANLLVLSDEEAIARQLLGQFFSQQDKIELWETALTLESLHSVRQVGPLIEALDGVNLDRRDAAARALGWIRNPGNRAVDALIRALTDVSQPVAVREEAAESLAYLHAKRAIPPLVSVLQDSDVRIRFWAVFALGTICDPVTGRNTDRRVVPALETMLADHEVTPGNWWSVGREALAMLGHLDPPEPRFRDQLAREIQAVMGDPNASPEDRRWAESYC